MSSGAVPQAERIHVHVDPAPLVVAYGAHRRRFASFASGLDEHALKTPSRCSEWSAADVLRHLADVDGWMQAIWAGGSVPFTTFDPRTTPHEFVVAGRSMSDAEARDRYVASSEKVATEVESSDMARWGETSISPLGFVPWWLSVLHVFWDSWLHERDIAVPLGIETPVIPEEMEPVFAYALTISGVVGRSACDVEVEGAHFVVDDDGAVSVTLRGSCGPDAPVITDFLSGRASYDREPARGLPRLFQ